MRGSLLRALEADTDQWVRTFEGTTGTHISKLVDIWGKPERTGKPGAYEYLWSKRVEFSSGGYSLPDGHTEQRVYDKHGRFKGTIETPKERYVPTTTEIGWCNIRIGTGKDGIITNASYDDGMEGIRCKRYFPFPKE